MPNKPHLPPDKIRMYCTNVRWTESEYKALFNIAQASETDVPKLIRRCVKEWAAMKKKEKNGRFPDFV
jgi:hypothetical protein